MSTRTTVSSLGRGRSRRCSAATATMLTGPLVLAGCAAEQNYDSSSSMSASSSPTSAAAPVAAPEVPPSSDRIPPVGPTWLQVADAPGLGRFVADGSGRTLYAFSNDTATDATCYGSCADTFLPALTTATPAGGIGIDIAAAGTVSRRGGDLQASYGGHPLYYYAGDTTPGQVNGHDLELFGGQWYLVTPDGDRVP